VPDRPASPQLDPHSGPLEGADGHQVNDNHNIVGTDRSARSRTASAAHGMDTIMEVRATGSMALPGSWPGEAMPRRGGGAAGLIAPVAGQVQQVLGGCTGGLGAGQGVVHALCRVSRSSSLHVVKLLFADYARISGKYAPLGAHIPTKGVGIRSRRSAHQAPRATAALRDELMDSLYLIHRHGPARDTRPGMRNLTGDRSSSGGSLLIRSLARSD
jgi:hypothetical protein